MATPVSPAFRGAPREAQEAVLEAYGACMDDAVVAMQAKIQLGLELCSTWAAGRQDLPHAPQSRTDFPTHWCWHWGARVCPVVRFKLAAWESYG